MLAAGSTVWRVEPAEDTRPAPPVPGRTARGTWPALAGTAALTLAPTVVVLVMSTGGIEAEHRAHGAWPLLVVLGQSLPLVFLRWAPGSVLLLVAGVTAAQLGAGLPVTNGMTGQAIATAVVVARTGWPTSPAVPLTVLAASVGGAWVGELPGLPRFVVFTALSLVLAWVLGDAAGRRADVRRSMEEELTRRHQRVRLRARVAALDERLRITRELHDLVGQALDAVVLQAGAARAHLGVPESVRQLAAIEETGRRVLADLDPFLGYLRQPALPQEAGLQPVPAPVAVPAGRRLPRPLRNRWLTASAPALAVGFLVFVDALATPPADAPFAAWPAFAAAVVGVPLLLRSSCPETVLTVLVAALSGLTVLGTPIGNGVLGVAVALHAVASRRVRRRALTDAALACAVLVTTTVLVDLREAGELAGPLLGIAAVALYVGDTARVTREHNASLAQRIADAAGEERLRERVAVGDERTRLARELHDSIGHTLSLVILQAGAARLAAPSPAGAERVSELLRSIESSARGALGDLDRAVTSTSDPADEAGWVPGAEDLHGVVAGVRAAGTRVSLEAVPTDDLPRSLQVAIVRIAQEALTNVVKHAPGAAATVQVARSGEHVSVTVHNDRGSGGGSALPSGRRGIPGMRERVSMFQGQLVAGPDGRGGHLVEARIPLPRDGGLPLLLTGTAEAGGGRP